MAHHVEIFLRPQSIQTQSTYMLTTTSSFVISISKLSLYLKNNSGALPGNSSYSDDLAGFDMEALQPAPGGGAKLTKDQILAGFGQGECFASDIVAFPYTLFALEYATRCYIYLIKRLNHF